MAKKGGKRGGSSAARSAAAKKGWETRRRGGAAAKPAATKRTAASKPRATTASKPTARRGMPKTTSARGRALTNQRRAADLVRASRGGKGPSAKAVRSVLTAQRARAFYAATGGGKKRSAVKAKSAAKIGKSIRAQGRAKATAARAKVAGRPRSQVVAATGAKPAAQRPAATARIPRKRVDYAGAVSLGRSQDAARRRLARGEYTATGNGGWSMMWDRRQAKTPTEKLARDRVKGSLSELRKWQGTTRNQYASSQMKERAKREIARARKDVIKQVRIARAFRPAYLPETRRRYQASKG